MTDPISVVIADDQALIRGGLRAILDTQPDITVVAEAADGHEAVATVRAHRPDVALMDIRMPGSDGLTATRTLCADPAIETRVLVLSTFDLDDYVHAALRAGASGFLLKDTRPTDLAAAVRAVAAGDTLLSPTLTRRLVEHYLTRPRVDPTRLAVLTGRELDVLRGLAHGHTNSEIAAELYLSLATVKTHVTHLLTKLGLRDRVHAVITAYDTGLVQPTSHDTASGP